MAFGEMRLAMEDKLRLTLKITADLTATVAATLVSAIPGSKGGLLRVGGWGLGGGAQR
jgi:hypothetical protein